MIQLLLVLTTALTGPITPAPAVMGGGGPDAYGYRYLDSDTVCPGAPVYSWVSIRDIGTPITGLADDNVVGPFPIGFEFPYYWYRVNSVLVGSNGYITFGDNYLAAHPFANVPAAARPNNTLAALMSDMDYSGVGNTGKAWYWTNAAADTFIVECDSVKFWNVTGSVNTFEIILSRPDSSITMQFQKQVGLPPPSGWVPGNNTTGIENVTGAVGLSYLYGNIPTRNMLHDTLAVRYFPPDSSTFQVHDLATWRVMNQNNGGIFVLRDQPVTLWAKVKNTGNQLETGAPVIFAVRNVSQTVVFAETLTAPAMNPSVIESLTCTRTWTPTTNGLYTLRVVTNLTGDMFRGNDTVSVETRVVTYPAELTYDNGTVSNSMYWNGNLGGFGCRFVAPSYPIEVTAIKAMMNYQATATICTLFLFSADGPGGLPGTVLAAGQVNVSSSTPSWYQVNLSPAVQIDAGAFFVGVISHANQEPSYGMDTSKPMSYQSWEYTGSWAPSRDAANQDVMMHALVRGVTGVEELTPLPLGATMTARPNPFGGSTRIAFGRDIATPAKLEIYNATGEVVRTLLVSGTAANWDGKTSAGLRLAGGIYFARLADDRTPVLKVVLSR
jgi:hypothetical protein